MVDSAREERRLKNVLYQREYRRENKQRIADQRKAKRAIDGDAIRGREREYERQYRAKNRESFREKCRKADLKRWCTKYGITVEEFRLDLETQRGLCAICREPPDTRRLYIDHDHDTGKYRGLLCNKCNGGLGLLRDNPQLLRRGAEYLENTSK